MYVPPDYLESLTPGMRQWWVLKSTNYDAVIFFKVGKFYELYHMDAIVGVNELGFSFMKGNEFAHSGFPETAYSRMATTLVERGYKVARVEQTENPDMMTERIKKMSRPTKFDKVVNREICQITNLGTQIFTQQTQITHKHQSNFMMAIVEKNCGQHSNYGVCFIDTSIGDFNIGEFEDDKHCSRLLTLLAHNPPVLLLHERVGLTQRTQHIFKTILGNILKEPLSNDTQFWGAGKTLRTLAEKYYTKWPETLKLMQDKDDHLGLTPADNSCLALKALGGSIWYLTNCLLDQQVLAMSRYHLYTPPDEIQSAEQVQKKIELNNMNKHMVLDSITISNLRITGDDYSLLSTLDHCCTRFGKRLLHYWVCSPSCELELIKERQIAVSELLENSALLQEVRLLLGTLPDLERHLAQIHGFGNGERLKNHPDGRAILYEEKTYGKKKIQDFLSTLNGFETLTQLPKIFSGCESSLLKRLTQLEPTGIFPELTETLKFFKKAFDHKYALENGRIAPEKGVDTEYDSICEDIEIINEELQEYLKTQEKKFGCKVVYFGREKKRFQLEIPESNAKKAGSEYVLEGQKKGNKPVKRFHTNETKDFVKRMVSTEFLQKVVLKDLMRRIFEKFSNNYDLWKQCVDLVGTLDVLTGLAEYARNQGDTCIPEIVKPSNGVVFEIEEGFHPCMSSTDFIPNGVKLGESMAPLAILTGPNMGGKSTLMRQVGLLTVMVQIGSRIPAASCRMSLVDRIFTRLGAQDDIMAGHSTFLVELSETSAILKHATVNSLVLLDELGRGTATYDGTAIAASVVNFLADLKCRSLFSTHYHSLVDNFHEDQRISLGHMACMVENENNDDPTQETVTFLYKYSDGACPKSYGFNAAKLAGMPNSVIKRAHELSKKVEATALQRKLFSKILTSTDISQVKDLLIKLKGCIIKDN